MEGQGVHVAEFLHPEHIVAPLPPGGTAAAIGALLRRLVETGEIVDASALIDLFTDNRIRDVIHVGDRVLLPHLRTDAVARLVVAFGVAPPHAEPGPHLVVLVLAPPAAAELYLQTVAALARALRSDRVVDRLVAAATPADVLAVPEIRQLCIQPRLSVRDVMTQRVYRVQPDTSLRELVTLLTEQQLRAVPVVGEDREVLGMVTDRDVLRFLMPHVLRVGGESGAGLNPADLPISGVTVRDIMSRSVMCVPEDQPLAEVANVLLSKDVERLPVVSEGKLTGFLTRGDIIRKLFGL